MEIPQGGGEGMIVTDGGRFGGYDLKLGRQIRNENCGPELSPAHPVVGLMNLVQREIVI